MTAEGERRIHLSCVFAIHNSFAIQEVRQDAFKYWWRRVFS